MKKGLALFDFDGTITSKDSFIEFIKFNKGWFRYIAGMVIHLPILILYKLKLFSNQRAKEIIITHFFSHTKVEEFSAVCNAFSNYVIPKIVRPKAIQEISKLKELGFRIIIVSASPLNWIKQWADENNIELIASCLETNEGKITGRLTGKNCHGIEKVRRIKESIDLNEYREVYAYGDTSGDLHMLELAHKKYYKPFRD